MNLILVAPLKTSNKIFHLLDCQHARRISDSNKIFFLGRDQARALGYRQCECCSRLKKYYEKDKEQIDKFLIQHGMTMYIEDDSMFIENREYAWKITTRNKDHGLILYHANAESYNKLQKKNGHLIHNYHVQKYKGPKDIISYLKYIDEHDTWKRQHLDAYKELPTRTKNEKKNYRKAKASSKKKKVKNVLNILDKIKVEENTDKKGKLN